MGSRLRDITTRAPQGKAPPTFLAQDISLER
ncbi:hypothetical protein L915_15703 [Phytophthora nicotianae]|uniref:Uncharacterized protein n=1 Tax=Phytophthora nicotianae TaxID=4792 RepID=W2IC62_PHYNI|nr:hypothetical protein L915_15703 [Phytophthora nicotianae]ETL31650.1 hypothetical protein L916_15598 [Phytophthora nicotianae]